MPTGPAGLGARSVVSSGRPASYAASISAAGRAAAPPSDAVQVSLSGSFFRMRLEGHLNDVRQGRGHRSAKVGRELNAKHAENADFLSSADPQALQAYSGLLGGLSYSRGARMVAAVSDVARSMGRVQDAAAADQEELTRLLLDEYASPRAAG